MSCTSKILPVFEDTRKFNSSTLLFKKASDSICIL
nr:MAG TPA: hypothetical protein [Bacteriophage sp.]